jgi:myo-inositol-1(or 4)-monophosphatase
MKNITPQILSIIRSTRSITLPFYGKAEIIGQKDNSPSNVVTKLDNEVEQYLKSEFKKVNETIEFAGEEFGGSRDKKKLWLVDPIDGTIHFIRGIPYCTTMVALIEDGQVVFSAIYDFVNDIMYYAEKGKGAFKNEEKLKISDRKVNQSIIGFESSDLDMRDKMRERCLLLNHIVAGYEFILVATGKVEGRICYNPFGKDYDYAPGSLLVSEAGGFVANIGSSTYDYRNTNFIAGNKYLFDNLTKGPSAIFPIVS